MDRKFELEDSLVALEMRKTGTSEERDVERQTLQEKLNRVTAELETRSLTVTYGGLNANDDVNISVEKGKLTGLIGPNGAGKTTFIDAITGFTPPSSGLVLFDGQEINHLTPDARAKIGRFSVPDRVLMRNMSSQERA